MHFLAPNVPAQEDWLTIFRVYDLSFLVWFIVVSSVPKGKGKRKAVHDDRDDDVPEEEEEEEEGEEEQDMAQKAREMAEMCRQQEEEDRQGFVAFFY